MEKIKATITKFLLLIPLSLLLAFPTLSQSRPIHHNVILYTPYVSRSVTPGKSFHYTINVINTTNDIQDVHFSLRDIPSNWNPSLSAGVNTIQEISVKPKSLGSNSEKVKLSLKIPLKIRKGHYNIKLIGRTADGNAYTLPLRVNVTKKGVFKTEVSVRQSNMEGYASSHFTYYLTISNRTGQRQDYALISNAPPGWNVRFKTDGDNVTSISVASNKSKNIFIKVNPSPNVKAGKYNIHVEATSGNTSDQANLETVIQGKYAMKLTTPTGRLSRNITAGDKKQVKLLLKNTGSLVLHDISLGASAPTGWSVSFKKKKIAELDPGKSTFAVATIKSNSKAIAGDYSLQFDANTNNVSSHAQFRITVSKSFTTGIVGIIIILIVLGGIAYLFKKYGRR